MLLKNDAISILEKIKNEENQEKIEKYKEKINNLSDEAWGQFLEAKSIKTVVELEKFANILLRQEDKFVNLNNLVSFGISGATMHIHLVPTDVRSMFNNKGHNQAKQSLIDALEKIQDLLIQEEFKEIENIFAISPILRGRIIKMFDELAFSTETVNMEDVKDDSQYANYAKFYNMFKGKGRMLGWASISRKKLLSPEWNELKENIKKEDEGR